MTNKQLLQVFDSLSPGESQSEQFGKNVLTVQRLGNSYLVKKFALYNPSTQSYKPLTIRLKLYVEKNMGWRVLQGLDCKQPPTIMTNPKSPVAQCIKGFKAGKKFVKMLLSHELQKYKD